MVAAGSFFHRVWISHRGRQDGKKNIPPSGAVGPVGFEKGLIDKGNQFISRYCGTKVAEQKNRLEGKEKGLLNRLTHTDEDYRRIKAMYEAKGRDLIIPFPPVAYWILFSLLVLGEFPFNMIVFQVFAASAWLTWIMAGTVCIAIPVGAHFTGLTVREATRPWWSRLLAALLFTGVIGAALVALNYIRIQYLKANPDAAGLLPTDPETLEYAYFAINFLVFTVATIASYFSHDADPELVRLKGNKEKLEQKQEALQAELEAVCEQRDGLRAKASAQVTEISAIMTELVGLYRAANQRKRKTDPPAHFNTEPTFMALPWEEVESTERATLRRNLQPPSSPPPPRGPAAIGD